MRITGRVVAGSRVGRALGYPTANLAVGSDLDAASGVYAARVWVDGGSGADVADGVGGAEIYGAMAYLGAKPTFESVGERVLELHLFDFEGDLYGREMRAELVGFVRPERKFASPEELKVQIARDEVAVKAMLAGSGKLSMSVDIEFLRLTDTTHPLFAAAWRLYLRSFPREERRQLRSQRGIMTNPLYHFEVVTEGTELIGIRLWWAFDDLRYLEHLATMPRLRGRGYGARILAEFIARADTPVILEVEIPIDEMSRRRVGFYERAGFVASKFDYTHPPYKNGGERVPLMLMSHPRGLTREMLARFLAKHAVVHAFTLGNGKSSQTKLTPKK